MKQKPETGQTVASGAITDMRPTTPKQYSAEERSSSCLTTNSSGRNLKAPIEGVIDYSNHKRFHESIENLTHADV